MSKSSRVIFTLALLAAAGMGSVARAPSAENNGIVRVASAVPIGEAAKRVKQAIAEKGIQFFSEIDQAELAAKAGIAGLGSADLRQSAAWNAVHHRQPECRPRLACTAVA
jgi:hypothetical protein